MGLDVDIMFKDKPTEENNFVGFGTDGAFLSRLFNEDELETCDCEKEITAKELKTVMITFVKETLAGFNDDCTTFKINKKDSLYIDDEYEYEYRKMALLKVLDSLRELKDIDDGVEFIIHYSS